ncbi:MAG: PIN domain-containing protein [Planctomycetota bacterium]|jgi:predicted nucleic acid-binding protein
MVFDTDVLVWALRGNARALQTIDRADELFLSTVAQMELFRGARDKGELRAASAFLADLGFDRLPLTETIGDRALVYIEEYALKSGIDVADALIAATAVENAQTLCTGNARRFRAVSDLTVKAFRP